MQEDEIIRRKESRKYSGLSHSAQDRAERSGTFPPAFKLLPDPRCRSVGYLKSELLAWQRARVRGATEDEIRELVRELIAARKGAA